MKKNELLEYNQSLLEQNKKLLESNRELVKRNEEMRKEIKLLNEEINKIMKKENKKENRKISEEEVKEEIKEIVERKMKNENDSYIDLLEYWDRFGDSWVKSVIMEDGKFACRCEDNGRFYVTRKEKLDFMKRLREKEG